MSPAPASKPSKAESDQKPAHFGAFTVVPLTDTKSTETFPGWMAGFCIEPHGDVDHCCLACCVPAAMYGKTHWRLDQVGQGEDPLDTSWNSGYGCNGPCWVAQIFMCLGCAIGDLGFIPVGIERHRIRATYNISGNWGKDFGLAFFCRPCTLLQNDREVRARHGARKCATCPAYKKYKPVEVELVTTEPIPPPEMTYQPQTDGATQGPLRLLDKPLPTFAKVSCSHEPVLISLDGGDSSQDTRHHNAQNLSYVHDFSEDCSVNGQVLQYYEMEGGAAEDNPYAVSRVVAPKMSNKTLSHGQKKI